MPISSKVKILQDTVLLTGRRITNLFIGLLQAYFTVRFLGPENYGVLAIIGMVPMIAGYLNLGWLSVVMREIPHYRGVGDVEAEIRLRNNAFSVELLMTAVCVVVSLTIALFYVYLNRWDIALLLILAAVALIPQKLLSLYNVRNFYEKDFRLQTKVDVYRQLVASVLIIGTVWKYGIYSVLIVPILADILCVFYYRTQTSLNFTFSLQKPELKRMTKIGIPLAITTLLSSEGGVLKMIERTLLAMYVPLKAVGYYAFAAKICGYFMQLLQDATSAFQPHLYENLGRENSIRVKQQFILKPTRILFYAFGIFMGSALFVLPSVIAIILPRYIESILIMKILLIANYITHVTAVNRIILYSVVMNKQVYYSLIWAVTIVVFSICSYMAVLNGYGATGIAISLLISYTTLNILTFCKTFPFYLKGKKDYLLLVMEMIIPIMPYILIDCLYITPMMPVDDEVNRYWFLLIRIGIALIVSLPLLIRLNKISGIFDMMNEPIQRMFYKKLQIPAK